MPELSAYVCELRVGLFQVLLANPFLLSADKIEQNFRVFRCNHQKNLCGPLRFSSALHADCQRPWNDWKTFFRGQAGTDWEGRRGQSL